jgi:hypothetical protein
MSDDFNAHYLRQGDQTSPMEPYQFGRPIDIVELPASWVLTDVPCFEFVWGSLPGAGGSYVGGAPGCQPHLKLEAHP